jgi:hypothetical protein
MRRIYLLLIAVFTACGGVVFPCAATLINLDLYNTEALLNSDAFTPLLGNTTSGDLVQVILLGAGNTVNAPDQYGNPTGNNTLLSFGDPTNSWLHVGYGLPSNPDQGLLDVFPLQYDPSLVGTDIVVRFFNAPTLGAATYYGNSSVFTLPVGTGPNSDQAQLDFVPTGSNPHVTDQPFNALVIPEPANLFAFGLIAWGYGLRRRRLRIAVA